MTYYHYYYNYTIVNCTVHSVRDLNGSIIATMYYNVLATHVCYTTKYYCKVIGPPMIVRDSARSDGCMLIINQLVSRL